LIVSGAKYEPGERQARRPERVLKLERDGIKLKGWFRYGVF
jgi:hypothetical protein